MKVQRITVKNLKAVSELTADFKGCTAIITGRNDSGKSSFLKSLPERIRGNKPDEILKKGESEGFAEYELTDGSRFIWTFDQSGEKLKLVTQNNLSVPITKEIARRYFPPLFDIDEFLQSTPKKQSEIIQKTFGVDFSKINADYKYAYDERTAANNNLKSIQARVKPIKPDLPNDIVSITDLTVELNKAQRHNDAITNAANQIESIKKQIDVHLKEIEKLKKQSLQYEEEAKENQIDVTGIQDKIRSAGELNIEITVNNQNKKIAAEFESAKVTAEELDEKVKEIEAERQKLIESIKLPDGFRIDDEGITFNGFPMSREQLSSSGIYIAALKLASIGIGEVRTMHFDASFLDKINLEKIESWANENDLQLLIERPDFDAGEITYELLG